MSNVYVFVIESQMDEEKDRRSYHGTNGTYLTTYLTPTYSTLSRYFYIRVSWILNDKSSRTKMHHRREGDVHMWWVDDAWIEGRGCASCLNIKAGNIVCSTNHIKRFEMSSAMNLTKIT